MAVFEDLIKRILKAEKEKGKVNLVLMDDREIRKLNLKFRKKDKATDVLAFSMGENGVLGDIAISKETTQKNAKRFGVSYKNELKRLVIHGILHLLGYDHGRKMRDAEEVYQKF